MSVRAIVRRAVVETNPYWPFSALNRLPYRLALAATSNRMRRIEGVRGLYLRNGLTRPNWVPGISDIDLTIVVEDTDAPLRDYAGLGTIWSEYASLKRAFPMLGELDVLTESTLPAWRKIGVAGYESRDWIPVIPGSADLRGESRTPGDGGLALDACDYALLYYGNFLLRRLFGGDARSPVVASEMRRLASKVLRYAALARGDESAARNDVPADPAKMATVALRALDETVRGLERRRETGADEPDENILHTGDSPLFADLPVEGVVEIDTTRFIVLEEGLDSATIRETFDRLIRASDPSRQTHVATPAVFEHLVRVFDPFLFTSLLHRGRVVHGRCHARRPPARSFARSVLAQAPNVLLAARSRDLVPPFDGAFIPSRQFDLAVERALFVKVLCANGAVGPQHYEMVAASRELFGPQLARAAEIRAGVARNRGNGFEAFALLRELAADVAREIMTAGETL
jgi:hypothetical protein